MRLQSYDYYSEQNKTIYKKRTMKQEIKRFKKETGINLVIKDGKLFYDSDLDLHGTGITALPDNLTVGGSLYLHGTGNVS